MNQTNGRITPIEILETEYPLRITEFSVLRIRVVRVFSLVVTRSEGFTNRWRMEYVSRYDRRDIRFHPEASLAAKTAGPGKAVLYPDGETKILSSREVNIPLNRGESFALDTPSGGGCGDPSELSQGSSRVA